MFETLTKGFRTAKQKFQGLAELDDKTVDEALGEVRTALLEADVGFEVVQDFCKRVKEKAVGVIVKVRASSKERDDMKRMADIFRGRIIDVTDKSYTIELTGTGAKLDAFIQALEQGTILETVRTGASGIGRGERILKA